MIRGKKIKGKKAKEKRKDSNNKSDKNTRLGNHKKQESEERKGQFA